MNKRYNSVHARRIWSRMYPNRTPGSRGYGNQMSQMGMQNNMMGMQGVNNNMQGMNNNMQGMNNNMQGASRGTNMITGSCTHCRLR